MSELSRTSGVSVASIKYYVREGLLPAGTPTSSNQASYGDDHVRRLHLIRSLIDIGGLSVAQVRATLSAVDDDAAPIHRAFGAVMHGLDTIPSAEPEATGEVQEWLRTRGWAIEAGAPAPYRLAELLVTLRQFGFDVSVFDLDAVANSAEVAAEFEVEYARSMPDRTAAVETMLVGTVVYERVYAEIRRLALEAVSARNALSADAPADASGRG